VTGEDEDNLVASQVAKHVFNVPRAVARINNPKNELIFRKLGIDSTVSATSAIMSHIEQELPTHSLISLLTLRRGFEIVEIKILGNASVLARARSISAPVAIGALSTPRRPAAPTPTPSSAPTTKWSLPLQESGKGARLSAGGGTRQRPMTRLAYLGPPGTFSEEAALRYRPGAQLVPCPTEKAAVAAVEAGDADEAVLPIENTLEGSVTRTVDILVHDTQLMICGELVLPIELCLIVKPGAKADDVKAIYSKPEALSQVRYYIERHFPNARQDASLSTAAAVEECCRSMGQPLVRRAHELYHAEIWSAHPGPHTPQTRCRQPRADTRRPVGQDTIAPAVAVR
jgi:hypothetical protein